MRPDSVNRRSEARVTIDAERLDGELVLTFDDPVPQEVRARLLDYSSRGFRAMHTYFALSTGQVVRSDRPASDGHAKVVWNRISGDQMESGFGVLPNVRR